MANRHHVEARKQRIKPVRHRQNGASLIEQIMVLVIIASLAGMATPPLRKMLMHSQIQTAQSDFMSALRHARETAVTSGKQTLFCPTVDRAHCSEAVHWDTGWLLAHDADLDNQPDGAPIYTGSGYAGKLAIVSSNGRRFVRFHPDGSASGSNLTLLFCSPSNTDNVLAVVIANSGRVRGASATSDQAAGCAQAR
ncbi:type IV fimbrial biogenesis protein FimT [Rhodanobacter sp. ANJX3]|jgi:type IV fimbrial biogenesis protein FimT|uniref:GspH/FimT family pseudopilin n=1 Tax=Rhodanobacter sp. ANJX3 TaxID=2723083 RepID=UPI001859E88F|nr:GspH/FimT family pseudopilin [Rhodanobacter sp. ANJX3]MBB5360641.1 type IV fimbrial biogenesis protein FimT [Rhodanobacter sp. ANJX3]